MLSPADKDFQKLVLQLFRQYHQHLNLTVHHHDESHLNVEVTIPALGDVSFYIDIVSTSTPRSEVDPDPRQFGDAPSVVAAAMQNWYPGKTSSWTEHHRRFLLEARNLPDLENRDYSAIYEYDPSWMSDFAECKEAEQIFVLLVELAKRQARETKRAQEQDRANQLNRTFKKLLG